MWFWSAQVSATFYKKILILLGFCLCAFILWMGVMEYATRLLKDRMGEVETLLKAQIGYPINYSSIEPHWQWGAIVLSLNDVVMLDNKTPIPFLSVKTLKLGTNPYRLIFKQDHPFNHLRLEGMKMVVGFVDDKDLTVLGLQGEWFPSDFDYHALLKTLSSQDLISFYDSEILWQGIKGPNTSITQRIEGKFSWEDIQNLSWQFSGKQKIKMNHETEFWPISFIKMEMNTPAKLLNLKAGMERTRLELKLNFPKNSQDPIYLVSNIEGRDIDLRLLHQNIRLNEADPEWLRWVLGAIERGSLTRGKVSIFGPVGNLDWHGEIDFHNVNLLYDKDWPRVRKANGKVIIEKDKVKVQVSSGNILGTPLKRVDALIEPIGTAESPVVRIEGSLNGRLENGIKFLLLSPLKKTLGLHLSPLKPTGLMDLHLNLKIPIGEDNNSNNSKSGVEVQGQVGIENGELTLEALELPMTELTGVFRFTEKGVEAKGVTAELLEKPVQIEANPSRVTATTLVNSEFLQEKFESTMLSKLKGESEMSVSYLNDGEWLIESSLQGMSIDLPYPFSKKTNDIQPIAFTIYPKEGQENYYALNAKDLVNAKWTTETKENEKTKEEETFLKRGQVILGAGKNADWISNNILYIGGELPYVDVEAWKAFLGNGEIPTQSLPIQLNVLIAQLEAFGLRFKNTIVKHLSDTTEWTLDGPSVKGSMILPSPKNKQLQFSFQHLKLNSNQIDAEHNTSFDLLKNHDRIPIIFNAQSLTFDEASFGETSFHLQPKPYGYEIQELTLRNKSSRLEGRGEWRLTGGSESSHLMGEILSDNMSQTFAQWGFSSAMQEGKGRIQFNLQWPGSPFQVSLKKVEGAADLKLRSGHILGMNPGLGKILGLLSLENLLTRRLKLDFSDVVKKGFVFDKLEANMLFKSGMVETDNLFIDGPAAKVKISGQANLTSKAIDLQMLVTPKVGNTLPVVASLTTGAMPVVGAGVWGVWIVDKLTGSRISEVSQKSYHVTGTWDAPVMNEVGSKTRTKARKR